LLALSFTGCETHKRHGQLQTFAGQKALFVTC
jgi:hypothetical protein